MFDRSRLPTDLFVGFSSDGASVMTGVRRGVAAKLKAEYNSKLFTQHCLNHRLVLVAKAAQKKIPEEVESTIKDLLDHFKYSTVAQSKLKEICELNDERFTKLIHYHKIRWLSLQDCIERIDRLHHELVEYLSQHQMIPKTENLSEYVVQICMNSSLTLNSISISHSLISICRCSDK